MPYARFDDRYDDHRKIKRALRREPAAVAMHAMAITYCNRFSTDGDVDLDWIEERLALMPYKTAQRRRVLEVLLEEGLFTRVSDEYYAVDPMPPPERVPLPRSLRSAVIKRDGLVCGLCSKVVGARDVHIDHILAVALGGTDTLDNLHVTHSTCNLSKGTGVRGVLV